MHKRLILLFLTCFLLSGCGEVSDKEDLLDYVESSYGDCELLSDTFSDNSRVLLLKDDEYSFEYRVTSYLSDMNVDGTSFGEIPSTSSTFTDSYLDFFTDKYSKQLRKLENDNDCSIEFYDDFNTNGSMPLVFLKVTKDTDYDSVCLSLISMLKEYDTREYLSRGSISISLDNESIGEYSLEDSDFTSKDDLETASMLESAYNIMDVYFDVDIYSSSELKFLSSEVLSIKDIQGLEDEQLAYTLGDDFDENNIKVWHYEFNNEEWIIADCLISPNGNRYVTKLN